MTSTVNGRSQKKHRHPTLYLGPSQAAINDSDLLRCPKCYDQMISMFLDTDHQGYQNVWWTCARSRHAEENLRCDFPLFIPTDVFWVRRSPDDVKNGIVPRPNIRALPKKYHYLYPSFFPPSSLGTQQSTRKTSRVSRSDGHSVTSSRSDASSMDTVPGRKRVRQQSVETASRGSSIDDLNLEEPSRSSPDSIEVIEPEQEEVSEERVSDMLRQARRSLETDSNNGVLANNPTEVMGLLHKDQLEQSREVLKAAKKRVAATEPHFVVNNTEARVETSVSPSAIQKEIPTDPRDKMIQLLRLGRVAPGDQFTEAHLCTPRIRDHRVEDWNRKNSILCQIDRSKSMITRLQAKRKSGVRKAGELRSSNGGTVAGKEASSIDGSGGSTRELSAPSPNTQMIHTAELAHIEKEVSAMLEAKKKRHVGREAKSRQEPGPIPIQQEQASSSASQQPWEWPAGEDSMWMGDLSTQFAQPPASQPMWAGELSMSQLSQPFTHPQAQYDSVPDAPDQTFFYPGNDQFGFDMNLDGNSLDNNASTRSTLDSHDSRDAMLRSIDESLLMMQNELEFDFSSHYNL